MTTFYMQRALSLAGQALGNVSPNPAVGAVVVSDGKIVGEGYTQPPGAAHAEVMALKQAGTAARGATLYCTLEPCCHYGRTPPCTDLIISSGISEVHMAMLDPNPLVDGKGKAQLEKAGLKTYTGEGERDAQDLIESYIKHITAGVPFVTVKFAMSLDGKIATRTFDSKWISSEQSRQYVHQIRRVTDAIMVGVNTVLRDDPQLTARTADAIRQPLRVIVDSRGQTPLDAKALHGPGKALIATTQSVSPVRLEQYLETEAETIMLPSRDAMVDMPCLMRALGEKEITSVLVEGGSKLLGSLFDLGLVDKVIVFIAPIIIGGSNAVTPVAGSGVDCVANALHLNRVRLERFENDIMICGYTR